jgi:type IV pilus assembly protein PilM
MPATPSFLKADISAESLKKLLSSRPTLPSLKGGTSTLKGTGGSSKRGGRARAATTLVGLDIQPGYVSAVQVRVNGKIEVQRAVGAPLPADTVREGEVIDGQALTETLRELFAGARLDKRVRIGVANQRTVLRTLEMPPIPEGKELETAVRFQAEDQVPMPLESAVLDYQTLGVVDTPAGQRQRVVVVAAQKDMVEKLIAAVRAAGLRPEGVDLSAFALIRSLHRAGAHEGRVLYLNVGGLTNMAIADGTDCRFTRVAAGGLESMATAIAERNGIPLAKARELLAAVDLSVSAPVTPPAENADEEAPTAEQPEIDVRPVLAAGVREIASEVRNSLDFHRSQGGGDEVSTVVLSGAALQIAGFADALQAELSVPVVVRTVALGDAGAAGSVSPERLAVAAGLAVEEAPR